MKMAISSRLKKQLTAAAAGLAMLSLSGHGAEAAQTKSFVVSWFTPAVYSQDDDCPGRNPSIDGIYKFALRQMNLSEQEERHKFEKYVGTSGGDEAAEIIINRARINGKPVNAYANPLASPDPNMFTVTGTKSFGFNLDGKVKTNDFEEAETHEKGIDNEFFRAMGCHTGMRAYYPNRPLQGGEYQWDTIRLTQPAWLVTISGEDLSKEGDVTVTFQRALEATKWDALSQTRQDMTYRIDPNPRSHSVAKGHLKDGVITTTAPFTFNMVADPYYVQEFRFKDAQIRLKLLANGQLDGFIGGYQPFDDPYWGLANGGIALECCAGIDFVGVYHTLKRLADAYPDDKGQNTHISTAYRIEGVPAFTVDPAAQNTAEAPRETKTR
jgi:hypothetical protein